MAWSPFLILFAFTYVSGLLAVGYWAGRQRGDSNQFLNATASLPLWVCATACVAANCGSLDVIAMMALGAQYGILACHFYWVGAIPALVVMAFWLLPAYARRWYPSVLDFIGHSYGTRVQSLVALSMAAMMLLLAGVSLCAVAQVLTSFLGWSFLKGVLLIAALVFTYIGLGGFRATVYTELLHFALVLATVLIVFIFVLRDFGGFHPLLAAIPPARLHAWSELPWLDPRAVMDRLGVIFGLGLVLGFGYWSTDFVQMQRALAVRTQADVPLIPLTMAMAKMVFSCLIVLPGIAAPLIIGRMNGGDWNATLPRLMLHYFSPAWIVVGVGGLVSSLVSTFANNVSGFSAVWVQSIYQRWIARGASDAHYLRVGRITNATAIVAAIGAAYLALSFHSLMEYIQLILSIFNAPLFALVALAALMPGRAARGGMPGLVIGLAGAIVHQTLIWAGVLHYGSRMAANFYGACFCFALSLAVSLSMALGRPQPTDAIQSEHRAQPVPILVTPRTALLAALVAGAGILINYWFR